MKFYEVHKKILSILQNVVYNMCIDGDRSFRITHQIINPWTKERIQKNVYR